MQPITPEQTQADQKEHALCVALAAAMDLPADDPAVVDWVHSALWIHKNRRWATLPAEFQNGELVGVNGATYRRDARRGR
jgi:hypothetical protein